MFLPSSQSECTLHATSDKRALQLQRLDIRCGAEGQKAEAAYAKDKTLPDPSSTDNPEFKIVLSIIKAGLEKHPQKYTNMAKALKGTLCALVTVVVCCAEVGCSM